MQSYQCRAPELLYSDHQPFSPCWVDRSRACGSTRPSRNRHRYYYAVSFFFNSKSFCLNRASSPFENRRNLLFSVVLSCRPIRSIPSRPTSARHRTRSFARTNRAPPATAWRGPRTARESRAGEFDGLTDITLFAIRRFFFFYKLTDFFFFKFNLETSRSTQELQSPTPEATMRAVARLVAGSCCLLAAALLAAAQPPAINSADPGTDSARLTPVGG